MYVRGLSSGREERPVRRQARLVPYPISRILRRHRKVRRQNAWSQRIDSRTAELIIPTML